MDRIKKLLVEQLGRIPMQKLVQALKRKGVPLNKYTALELFGGDGSMHTRFYSKKVKSLEIWEMNPKLEPALKRNMPQAKIRITNSFDEVKRNSSKFNLVVVDNFMSISKGEDGVDHCEHFDLFPHVLNLLEDDSVLIVNVIPSLSEQTRANYPKLFNDRQLNYRREFYQTEQPERISLEDMEACYKKRCEAQNLEYEWSIFVKRTDVYYLAIKLKRKG